MGANVKEKGKDVFYIVTMDFLNGALPLLNEDILQFFIGFTDDPRSDRFIPSLINIHHNILLLNQLLNRIDPIILRTKRFRNDTFFSPSIFLIIIPKIPIFINLTAIGFGGSAGGRACLLLLGVGDGGNGLGAIGGFGGSRGRLARARGSGLEEIARACRGRGGAPCRGIITIAFISIGLVSLIIWIEVSGVGVIKIYNLLKCKGWTNLNIENLSPHCYPCSWIMIVPCCVHSSL